MLNPLHSEITASIVDAALQLHREIGPGMLESAYEVLLADELRNRGHAVVRHVALTTQYRGRTLDKAFRVDLLVDDVVIVEIKCSERRSPLYRRQLLTYMRLAHIHVGQVLNFGLETMKAGIDRVVNDRHIE
ncbi:GxxExxY protein [Gemmatimonas sp.]|uniref:GxxExxY protein n=1 Tax=Gemmatimonas sp. TaxID=1962908 RepID=UPI0027B8E849|nr:GxxExxY protein [Gemmatimonas sp.]